MKIFLFILILSVNLFSQQLTKEQIKEVLFLQYDNKEYVEANSEILYQKYIDSQHFSFSSLATSTALSSISGISLGFHESYTFGYKYSNWLPEFMSDWYKWRPETDAVFGKVFTFQKVFRDLDYATDRASWNSWKKTWNVKYFWSWQTLGAFTSHFLVKNTFATFVRDRMKHDSFTYSWQVELIFGNQLIDIFNELIY